MKKLFLFSLLWLAVLFTYSQPGKDGAYTVTGGNTILNKYSPVVSDITAGSNVITVVSQITLLSLCPGDLIMIYQAQGATISTTNTVVYGDISAYNSAGFYEFAYVRSVSGDAITTAGALTNNYTASGMAQVIKVPQHQVLTINTAGSVIPKAWKDTVVGSVNYRFGGIVALHSQNIINNGTISSSGFGFRGGLIDVSGLAFTPNISSYVSTIYYHGGEKGESIAGYQPEYDSLGGRYGRGAPANGGGGGNAWNSGGGGGANASNTKPWTGQGVMVVDASNPLAAWQLDPNYIANSNALTNSSGGGRGGYSNSFNNANATITGPNNPAWNLDGRKEVGGLGGRPLTNIDYNNRIYFGGGGGAGDENDHAGNNGGNGGGIVYLIATNGISGTGSVLADGIHGGNTLGTGYDAPSGAGGGGSIIILSPSVALTQTISATGGAGGNQFISNSEAEGPGGGGGGGFVAISGSASAPLIAGGAYGQTNSSSLTEFPANGATSGASGTFVTASNQFIAYNVSSILNLSGNSPVCIGSTININASGIAGAAYNWSGPSSYASTQQDLVIVNAQISATGIYTVSATVLSCAAITNTISVTVNDCVTSINENNRLSENVLIFPNPSPGNITLVLKDQSLFNCAVYNTLGQLVYSRDKINEALIDFNGAKGIYYITISNAKNTVAKTVIIE